jgi:6-pyruvoyltetrahydropterin/6-carboxytetrahydropterin synthase
MGTTATRRIELDAGHRLVKHPGKCAGVHGHRYAFEFTLARMDVDVQPDTGMVIDFDIVEGLIGSWLMEQWDHALLLEEADPLVASVKANDPRTKLRLMPCPPTAENLARLAYIEGNKLLLGSNVRVAHVTCYETPKSRAGYSERP